MDKIESILHLMIGTHKGISYEDIIQAVSEVIVRICDNQNKYANAYNGLLQLLKISQKSSLNIKTINVASREEEEGYIKDVAWSYAWLYISLVEMGVQYAFENYNIDNLDSPTNKVREYFGKVISAGWNLASKDFDKLREIVNAMPINAEVDGIITDYNRILQECGKETNQNQGQNQNQQKQEIHPLYKSMIHNDFVKSNLLISKGRSYKEINLDNIEGVVQFLELLLLPLLVGKLKDMIVITFQEMAPTVNNPAFLNNIVMNFEGYGASDKRGRFEGSDPLIISNDLNMLNNVFKALASFIVFLGIKLNKQGRILNTGKGSLFLEIINNGNGLIERQIGGKTIAKHIINLGKLLISINNLIVIFTQFTRFGNDAQRKILLQKAKKVASNIQGMLIEMKNFLESLGIKISIDSVLKILNKLASINNQVYTNNNYFENAKDILFEAVVKLTELLNTRITLNADYEEKHLLE